MMKMKPGAMQEAQHMRANVAATNASRTPLAAKAENERKLLAFKAGNAPAPAATAKAPPKGSLNPIKRRMRPPVDKRNPTPGPKPGVRPPVDKRNPTPGPRPGVDIGRPVGGPARLPVDKRNPTPGPKQRMRPPVDIGRPVGGPARLPVDKRNPTPGMAGGGMMKGYAKGGMANCGASMKPNGAKKGK